MAIRIATRGSDLARWQAEHVAGLLGVSSEIVLVETTGDRQSEQPIARIGGQGVFVKEVQASVLEGRADIAVHSAKDLPSATPEGLTIAAVPRRGDPRDALVGSSLDDLEPGSVVATGSVRRRAQLAAARPDLTFTELRGNIGTRLGRVPPGGAAVIALAALERLGQVNAVSQVLDTAVVLPQVGQGALAVECREDDPATISLLGGIDDEAANRSLAAERGYLAELGGGCELPVGALATLSRTGRPHTEELLVEGLLCTLDGRVVLRRRVSASWPNDPDQVGRRLARTILDECGGSALLEDLIGSAVGGTAQR